MWSGGGLWWLGIGMERKLLSIYYFILFDF